MPQLERALEILTREAPRPDPIDGLDTFWQHHLRLHAELGLSIERAMVGGFRADRTGYAFASGYLEALGRLLPALPPTRMALAATEEGGNHPRAIRTQLSQDAAGLRLEGTKRWTTLGPACERVLVIASRGEQPDGRPDLVAVVIPTDRSGVSFALMPETPFIPEIPHATLTLAGVSVQPGEVLDGDAYTAVLKPFRTIEDLHVLAAISGYLVQVGRRAGADDDLIDRLLALLCTLHALAQGDPTSAALHRALGGVFTQLRDAITDLPWSQVEDEVRQRWQRDLPLLNVAHQAREQRLARARSPGH